MTVKWSSSSYKQKSLQIFSGKKAPSKSYFPIFKLQLQSASVFPDAWSFSVPNVSHSSILSVCNHEPLGNWSVFWVRAFIALDFVFYSLGPPGDPPGFSYTPAKTVCLSPHHGRLTDLLRTTYNQIDKHDSKTTNITNWKDYSTRKWQGAPPVGLTNLAYDGQQETHWRENLKSAVGGY